MTRDLQQFPKASDEYDYEFLFANVIKKMQQAYQKGHIIAVVSNQLQSPPGSWGRGSSSSAKGKQPFHPAETEKIKHWQKKVANICQALGGIPLYIFAALARDYFRKPHPGMWELFLSIWTDELKRRKSELAMLHDADRSGEASYFVGDFAGRIQSAEQNADHKDTDRKFAINAGLKFFTPDAYFAGRKERSFELVGFNAKVFLSEQKNSASAAAPTLAPPGERELVLFVGFPGSGKSTYYDAHFKPAGYTWINQDTLKTRDKCIESARKALAAGRSVVIGNVDPDIFCDELRLRSAFLSRSDNTNRDKATRKHYIVSGSISHSNIGSTNVLCPQLMARECGVRVRCFDFHMPIEQAWHQNIYRALNVRDEPYAAIMAALLTGALLRRLARS